MSDSKSDYYANLKSHVKTTDPHSTSDKYTFHSESAISATRAPIGSPVYTFEELDRHPFVVQPVKNGFVVYPHNLFDQGHQPHMRIEYLLSQLAFFPDLQGASNYMVLKWAKFLNDDQTLAEPQAEAAVAPV